MTGRNSSIFLSLFSNFLFILDEKRKTVTNGTLKNPRVFEKRIQDEKGGKMISIKSQQLHTGGGDLEGSQVLTQCSNSDSNGVRFL
jgi:hypothetical protein